MKTLSCLLVVFYVSLLTACGMQGDLYLPEDKTEDATQESNKTP